MKSISETANWSPWRPFPDPRIGGLLQAPFGPGVYELRRSKPEIEMVLAGIGGQVAARMSSLLPSPYGCGTRNAGDKRDYVLDHIGEIEYRTLACTSREEAAAIERQMLAAQGYRFNR